MNSPKRRQLRRGLSTLELVLSLPILLFIMALMINYGTVATWKIRGLTQARHAVWASRANRSPHNLPRPEYWPSTAAVRSHGDGNVEVLDDPQVDLQIARGPTLPISPILVTVNRDLLDPSRGLRLGATELNRRFPLLASLGSYQLNANHRILDNKWQAQNMGLHHHDLRLDRIYQLPRLDAAYALRYYQAAIVVLRSPCRQALRPLDRDEELIAAKHLRDFYPSFSPHPYTRDTDSVDDRVEVLTDRIAEVPSDMEQTFDDLYNGVYD